MPSADTRTTECYPMTRWTGARPTGPSVRAEFVDDAGHAAKQPEDRADQAAADQSEELARLHFRLLLVNDLELGP